MALPLWRGYSYIAGVVRIGLLLIVIFRRYFNPSIKATREIGVALLFAEEV
jgi:hypothetical protein